MVPAAGYNKGEVSIPEAMQRLQIHIDNIPAKFQQLKTEDLLQFPAGSFLIM